MKTSTKITWGDTQPEYKQDAVFTTSATLQTWSRIEELRLGNTSQVPYACYEPDFWKMDGSFKFLPTDPTLAHRGFVSTKMSNASGVISPALTITATFKFLHSTSNMTFHFSDYTGDWVTALTVAFYDAGNSLIHSYNYTPTSAIFETNQVVANFQKIIITLSHTNNPYRYVRVASIDFVDLVTFGAETIKEAKVFEEFSPISEKLPINTCDLELFSADGDFSMLNPAGSFAALQQYQPITVYEVVGNETLLIGLFYLDTWENTSDTNIQFHCFNAIGLLADPDREYKLGAAIYSPATIAVGTLLDNILGAIQIPYDIDPVILAQTIKGWIPICSYRDALQQVAFALMVTVNCARNNVIKISTLNTSPTATITHALKSMDQKNTLKPLITGIRGFSHDYAFPVPSDAKMIFKGTLPAGTHEIKFNQPTWLGNIGGAAGTNPAYIFAGVNYTTFTVDAPGEIQITGLSFVDNQTLYTRMLTGIPTGTKSYIISIENATLIEAARIMYVAAVVLTYYRQRIVENLELHAPTIKVGDCILIDTLYGQQIQCVVESMDSDLGMGFASHVVAVGAVV